MFTEYRNKFIDILNTLDQTRIEQAANLMSVRRVYPFFVIGNGGSASNASHFAQDLFNAAKINAISLCNDISTITAIANDFSYDDIFSKQLERMAEQWSVLIAISGSGNSKNIIKAVKTANKMNMTIVGLTGFKGGELAELADYPIVVSCNDMRMIESAHSFILHYMIEKIIHDHI